MYNSIPLSSHSTIPQSQTHARFLSSGYGSEFEADLRSIRSSLIASQLWVFGCARDCREVGFVSKSCATGHVIIVRLSIAIASRRGISSSCFYLYYLIVVTASPGIAPTSTASTSAPPHTEP